jgi:prepilin-type N-terminal cleavage/methylation domain-containing protein
MNTSNINNLRLLSHLPSTRGFTIVELLIVIVVIGILAAIVIVAYNGVQNSARATQAQAAATTVAKKAEAYNADSSGGNGSYPASFSVLANAALSTSYAVRGISLQTSQFVAGTPPASPSTVAISTCTTPGGWRVYYYDYSTGTFSTAAKSPEYGGATDASTCGTTFLAS